MQAQAPLHAGDVVAACSELDELLQPAVLILIGRGGAVDSDVVLQKRERSERRFGDIIDQCTCRSNR